MNFNQTNYIRLGNIIGAYSFLILFNLLLGFSVNLAADQETLEVPKNLTLAKTLELVLVGNPELEAYSWDIRAGSAAVSDAKLLPNPQLGLQLENFAGSDQYNDTDLSESTLMLNQLIELGGKRSARTSLATHILESKKTDYEIKQAEVLGEAKLRFFHVAADQERFKLAKEITALAMATHSDIEKRVKAGKTSSVELKKVEIMLSQLKVEQEHAEHELANAKLQLATTWGAEDVQFKQVDVNLFARKSASPDYKKIIVDLENSTLAKRLITEQKVHQARVGLAEAGQIADLTFGLGVRHFEDTDSNATVFQLSMPLQIFDRNQHQVAKTTALQQKALSMQRKAHTDMQKLAYSLVQELKHSAFEMETSEKSILPTTKEALAIVKEGFQQGRFSYLELSDIQRTFFEAKQNYIKAALKYQEHVVELEKLTGVSLNDFK